MGRLDQYAKEIFANETPAITQGGAAWQPPAEINLTEVRLDGCLIVRDPARLLHLPAPWSEAREHDEIVVDVKMQGDHLDMYETERGLLRRQARQVQRMGDPKKPWDGDVPFWMITSHVPAVLNQRRAVRAIAPGCHRIETGAFQFLWIAANELPLKEELIPFLIARTGRALDELARWLRTRRPSAWLLRMIEFLPMSNTVHEEMLRFVMTKTEDPEVRARQELFLKVYVDVMPGAKAALAAEMEARVKAGVEARLKAEVEARVKAEVEAKVKAEVEAKVKAEVEAKVKAELAAEAAAKGRVAEARSALRRVLARRKLALSAEEEARIDACNSLSTLERWLEQAVEAKSTAEALQ
jgi:hypothetical protein